MGEGNEGGGDFNEQQIALVEMLFCFHQSVVKFCEKQSQEKTTGDYFRNRIYKFVCSFVV